MKKLHKIVFVAVAAMFAFSVSPLMENNNTNVANAATKRTTHHKKGTKKARYAKIRRRGNVYVTTFSGGYYYKDAALKHPAKKRGYKAGKTLRVKRVLLYHGLQRYQLTNGSYITAYHADFNYHYTYKRVANKMVNNETIVKAHKAKKAKKARKAKKSKKYSKKKKATKKKKANKKNNNNSNKQIINGNEFLMQGKVTKSVQAPTDQNADLYAGKHSNGDVWYQVAADGKNIVKAKFTFENGKWDTTFSINNTDTTSLQQGKITMSTKAPSDKDANDPYVGKHHEGDTWFQESADKKAVVSTFTYTNNSWKNNDDINKEAAADLKQNQDDYNEVYGQEMDPEANPSSDFNDMSDASTAMKLGMVAAMIERHDQGDSYNQNTPAPKVNFSNNTITINSKDYTVDFTNNTVTVDGKNHNISEYTTVPKTQPQQQPDNNSNKNNGSKDSSIIPQLPGTNDKSSQEAIDQALKGFGFNNLPGMPSNK